MGYSGNRRRFLRTWGALPIALGPALAGLNREAAAEELMSTPACTDGEDPTPRQMEGPFFKPRSPERVSVLEADTVGTKLILVGTVLSTRCRPVAGALLDFWQCDGSGVYDSRGFRLRGHQFTDAAGQYRLETILPGVYPGRTRHIHVKVQASGQPVLTTQVYFPREAENARDFLFQRELLMTLNDQDGGKIGRYDFVLKLA